ncbi:MAG: glycine betaine ABC transporter substrate-binding protein [Gemmatimonadota bacterium]
MASKPFAESFLLGEMFAQLLEARGYAIDRRHGLGATELAFGALKSGVIDVYPEYTGTGLLVILGDSVSGSGADVFAQVATAFAEQHRVRWLPPLGFENTYAIAVRPRLSDSLGLRSLSDLVREGPRLVAGFTPDFVGRSDGLAGLRRAHGLELREVRALSPAVKYQALATGAVDVVDGYSTDGQIERLGLRVLDDDLGFFPPYDAAALISERLVREEPAAVTALSELSGRIGVDRMRRWNARVEGGGGSGTGGGGEPIAAVAADALRELRLVSRDTAAVRGESVEGGRPLVELLWRERSVLASRTWRHLLLAGGSLVLACLVAIPLGLFLERRQGAEKVLGMLGVVQTIPGIALLAFMLPVLGIGVLPAMVALFLYSLYPIVRNTWTGVRHVDPGAVDAARAVGMTPRQLLRHVRLPLAAPVIMAGVRTAAVLNIGTATLAAFIGAGGLGDPIVSGLALADSAMVLSGAIPAALLAVIVDWVLGRLQRKLTPLAFRRGYS